ncbi:hypothetical protein Pfo_004782 [Paulownia fortunei]|nr:hypothetical protein Pfo_004782 [Paulownia fortunei]
MQGQRGGLNPFPETIDLNQGSFPDNTSMDRSASWDNRLNPVENRLSNYMLAPSDGNISCTSAANNCAQSNSGWDRGESSSSGNNLQEQASNDDSKTRLSWFSPFSACSGTDERSEDWSSEPSYIRSTSYVGNQVTDRSLNMQNCSSNRGSLNLNSNHGRVRENNCHRGLGAGLPHTLYKSGHSGTEQIPTIYVSSTNSGTSSGSYSSFSENSKASGPSFGTWGSSCKRKALEGTSGHFYPSGSSNSNQPMENIMQHSIPGCCTAPGNLSISSGPLNLSSTNHLERLNPRSVVGTSRISPGLFPSSSVPEIAENPARSFALRSNLGHHESVPFDTPRGTSARHSRVYVAQPQSQPISNSDTLELMSPMNPNINLNEPLIHVNEARGMHSYPWNGSFSSRRGSSSSSYMLSGERGSGAHEDVNVRSSLRDNPEYPMIVSAPQTRNILQEQIDWSFTPGTSVSSRNHSSGSRIGPSSGGRSSSTAWLPHQNQTSQDHQRLSEAAPWIPFPHIESDSGIQRSSFVLSPFTSSSSDETATTSRAQHQSDQRSAAFWMDMPGGDDNGWNVLAAVEGRRRLIRQVLNAMQRGVHLRAEDYMLIDPFVNGFAELHDRHRDMRLDVDNMSYEELLALEERIGNVSTGLSKEKIRGSMKQRKYEEVRASPKLEPCCICQEDYVAGDDIGKLDCGHEFHTSCIEQWLTLKNICPICKLMALET